MGTKHKNWDDQVEIIDKIKTINFYKCPITITICN